MGNCLKTQLKASVQNPDVPIYGEAIVKFFAGITGGSLKVSPGQTATLYPLAGGSPIVLSDSQEIRSEDILVDGEYRWKSKYNSFPHAGSSMKIKAFVELNLSQWKYFNGTLTEVNLNTHKNEVINISELPESDLVGEINLYGTECIGTLASLLSKYPNAGNNNTAINLYHAGEGFTGSVADLAVMKHNPYMLYLNSNIEGNFYDAIVGWRENIGETGEQQAYCGSGVHLWSVYPRAETVFTISWTANTASITVDGVTTTFDNSGNIIS